MPHAVRLTYCGVNTAPFTTKNLYVIICDTEVHTFISYVTHVVQKAIVRIRATTYARWCTYNRNLDHRYMHFSITYDQIHTIS